MVLLLLHQWNLLLSLVAELLVRQIITTAAEVEQEDIFMPPIILFYLDPL